MADYEFSVTLKRQAQLQAYMKKSEKLKANGKTIGDIRKHPPPRDIHPQTLSSTRSVPSLHDYNIGAGVPLFGGRFKNPLKITDSWWANPPVDPEVTCLPVHKRLAVPKTIVRSEEVSPFFKDSHAYEDRQFKSNLRTYRRGPYPGHYL